jgi:hypothetical protein
MEQRVQDIPGVSATLCIVQSSSEEIISLVLE